MRDQHLRVARRGQDLRRLGVHAGAVGIVADALEQAVPGAAARIVHARLGALTAAQHRRLVERPGHVDQGDARVAAHRHQQRGLRLGRARLRHLGRPPAQRGAKVADLDQRVLLDEVGVLALDDLRLEGVAPARDAGARLCTDVADLRPRAPRLVRVLLHRAGRAPGQTRLGVAVLGLGDAIAVEVRALEAGLGVPHPLLEEALEVDRDQSAGVEHEVAVGVQDEDPARRRVGRDPRIEHGAGREVQTGAVGRDAAVAVVAGGPADQAAHQAAHQAAGQAEAHRPRSPPRAGPVPVRAAASP